MAVRGASLLRRCSEDPLQNTMQKICRAQKLMAARCDWHKPQLDASSTPNSSQLITDDPSGRAFLFTSRRKARGARPTVATLSSDASGCYHGIHGRHSPHSMPVPITTISRQVPMGSEFLLEARSISRPQLAASQVLKSPAFARAGILYFGYERPHVQ